MGVSVTNTGLFFFSFITLAILVNVTAVITIGIAFILAWIITRLYYSYAITRLSSTEIRSSAVLITGCSGGIGGDAATRLARKGFKVFATVRKLKDANYLTSLNVQPGAIVPVILDVCGSDEEYSDAVASVKAALGSSRLIAVVNNAGYAETCPVELMSKTALTNQFNTNVIGLVRVCQAFLPLLRDSGRGCSHSARIVNISSGVGRVAFPGMSAYCATKHAVEAISSSLRMEIQQFGIDVVVIEPGAIETNFSATTMATAKKSIEDAKGTSKCGADVYSWYSAVYDATVTSRKNTKRSPASVVTDDIEAAIVDGTPAPVYMSGSDMTPLFIVSVLPAMVWQWMMSGSWKKIKFISDKKKN